MTTLPPYSRIAVLGAGAWGTALALAALAAGATPCCGCAKTMCWRTSPRRGENNRFLPGVTLPKILRVTGDLAEAAQADALLLVVPAQVLHGFRAHAWRP